MKVAGGKPVQGLQWTRHCLQDQKTRQPSAPHRAEMPSLSCISRSLVKTFRIVAVPRKLVSPGTASVQYPIRSFHSHTVLLAHMMH